MNPLEELARELSAAHADITWEIDAPVVATGTWFLDMRTADSWIVVLWRPALGFVLSFNASHAYDISKDEEFPDEAGVRARLEALLEPPRTELLAAAATAFRSPWFAPSGDDDEATDPEITDERKEI